MKNILLTKPGAGLIRASELQAARQLGRSGVGLDLSLKYLQEEARERLKLTALDDHKKGKAKKAENNYDDLPFGGSND